MSDIVLVFPEVTEDLVSNLMVSLTKHIDDSGHEKAVQGLLGGEYGYGAHYKNDVFEMRPFYWGDCVCHYDDALSAWESANDHDKECYQTLFHEMHWKNYKESYDYKDGHGFNDECDCIDILYKRFGIAKGTPGSYVHCTCNYSIDSYNFRQTISHNEDCEVDKPNFKHYASGIEVEWYKYIGRDMEYDNEVSVEKWVEVFKDCIQSLKLGGI